jgi:Na+-driven multidrug efflux pump
MLGVGTTALISQAAGQKDQPRAELVFNQSFVMSILIAAGVGRDRVSFARAVL